jgi:uncharacterized protein YfaS (alpha-2-macroglobulin family)
MRNALQLLAVCLLFLVAACFRGNELRITQKNFDGEISRAENLVLTLSHDVAPDSLLGTWDTTQYLQFDPPIAGKYRWESANQLIFSPMQPFTAGTDYTATFTNNILTYLPKDSKVKLGKETLNFHTPYLELEKAEATWQTSSGGEAIVGAILQFTEEVNPTALAEKLRVTANGSEVKYNVISTSSGKNMRIEIRGLKYDDETDFKFEVAEGMKLNGDIKTKATISNEAKLPPPDQLTVIGVEADHDGAEGHINVTTSQQCLAEGLEKMISIQPKVPFTVSVNANGFSVDSDEFDPVQTYTLTIDAALTGVFQSKLGDNYVIQTAFGKLQPSISFVEEAATYLSNKGNKNVAMRIVAVPKVKVKIHKIFAHNIMSFLRSGMDYDGYWDEATDEYHSFRSYQTENYGQQVFEQEYSTTKMKRVGQVNLLHLDFTDKLPQFDGIYVVEVRDFDRQFITDSKIISFSDIGLIVKREPDGIYVFANSIIDATPMSDVKVSFVSKSNMGFHTATTDRNGVAMFSNIKAQYPDFTTAMVTAEKGTDFNYILLDETAVNTARFDVSGKYSNDAKYDAFIYGDREMYRPGETIHTNTIVRKTDWAKSVDMPIRITLLQPNGKEYRSIRKNLNQEGAADADFELPASAVTGNYTVEAYTGNDILIGSKSINVEEFMPDRIKVDIATDKKEAYVGQTATLNGTAVNLFGPPAADRKFEVQLNLKRDRFEAKGLDNYLFEMENYTNFDSKVKEGQTDANGKFTAAFDIPAEYADMGVLQAKFWATVFDESGRPVNRVASMPIYTQDVFYGIGNFSEYVSTRNPMNIPLVAVNKDGNVMSADANIKIIRHEWRTVLQSSGNGTYRYESQQQDITEIDKTIKISGKDTKFAYTPSRSGDYEVRISRAGSKSYLKKDFYAYRFGDTESTSFAVNREGRVDIDLDKEKYNVGETAKILFTCPFEGRLLVTLERDHVIQHLYFDTDKKAKQISIPLNADLVPNVFVSATLIRPMRELNVPLTVAHGYTALMVENPKNKLPIDIEAAENARSKTKQKIRIKTEPNTELTVAVVDEGILQIKNTKTPAPYDFFYQKRALEVTSHDIYPYLFPEMVANGMLTGGDGGYDLSKRVNPLTNKRVKLVTYWSGTLKSDSKGMVNYEVSVPQFSGDLRVMAVAYKDARFGSSDAHIKIADPVVINSGLPRFLSPRDTITVPVTLANTTAKAADAKAAIKVEGPLAIVGSNTANANLPANAEGRVSFQIVALDDIGEGKITITANAMNETFSEVTDITVRPPASLQKVSGSGAIDGGKSEVLAMANNFTPESTDGKLIISRSPLAQFSADLEYLIGYPYGCVEQTVSQAFPQVYFFDLSKSVGANLRTANGANSNNPNWNVQEAISKLNTMQLGNGGLSYWQGGDEENWWGSVFAAHFLWEAQKAGFEVNQAMLDRLMKYIQQKLAAKETYTYKYKDANGKVQTKEIARKEIIYSLYVLSLAGKPQLSTMNYYKAKAATILSIESRYLLAAAYTLAGDANKAKQVLPNGLESETTQMINDYSFDSPVRQKALALNALIEIDPNHQQIGILTKHLTDDFRKDRYHNTQESVFTLLALGKLARLNNDNNITATISAGGKKIADFKGQDITLSYSDFKAGNVQIAAQGNKGKLYYFWDMEGLTRDGSYKQEDNFLKVRKQFFDRFGKPLAGNSFKQNDLVVVKISLTSTGSSTVGNVVVTDILPAGFEVENPRITDKSDMPWMTDAALPNHQDFRDDRVNFFVTATDKPQYYYYTVRAVSPGKYRMGPVSADAMYAGEYHSYNGAGNVNISL